MNIFRDQFNGAPIRAAERKTGRSAQELVEFLLDLWCVNVISEGARYAHAWPLAEWRVDVDL